MPWQRHVADVALEVSPVTGKLAYREVVLTVPRQSGKTFLLLCLMVHRAQGFGGPQRIVYTAQTRNDARRKWEDEHVAILDRSPLRDLYRVRRNNGSEAIRWNNGSMHAITSSTERAGHGETLDLAVLDEAFAHEDARLEQGLSPTMITRPQPQLWIVSTAGTRRSLYLRGKIDAGRVRVAQGVRDSAAYFEWSAPPEADPGDEETWRACMPALGHTVDIEAIRTEYARMDLPEFRRAYLNQWADDAPDDWSVISRDAWMALADPASTPVDPVAFAVDVSPDRAASAIAVAGQRSDGLMHVEVAEHDRGTGWVVDRLRQMVAKWSPSVVVVDPAGPAGSLIPYLERAGIEVTKPTIRDAAQACGALYDAVTGESPYLRHLDQPVLNSALSGALRREVGDSWLWARRGVSVDISPLVGVTLALWGHSTAKIATDAEPFALWGD